MKQQHAGDQVGWVGGRLCFALLFWAFSGDQLSLYGCGGVGTSSRSFARGRRVKKSGGSSGSQGRGREGRKGEALLQ